MSIDTLLADAFRHSVTADTARIVELASTDPGLAVPSCPGWDVARLAGHVGRVHRMAVGVLTNTVDGFAAPETQEKPPTDPTAAAAYLAVGAEQLDTLLVARDPASACWNFLNEPMHAYFWFRRMAHETAVHRVDAEGAFAPDLSSSPVSAELAIDGVNEYFVLVRERLLPANANFNLGGSLHLHVTDATGEWMITVNDGFLNVDHGHGKGDAAIRGTASDLFLGVWGRLNLATDDRFERFGSPVVVSAFAALGGT